RLGVLSRGDEDSALMSAAYAFLAGSQVGYDRFFFDLRGGSTGMERAFRGEAATHAATHYAGPAWEALREVLSRYEAAPGAFSPYFERARPCTLLIDEVEAIWDSIAQRDDWSLFHAKIADIREMGAALADGGVGVGFHDAVARGARLFDAGAFFEAHEAWEGIWRRETDPGRRIGLQALIQAAAAFHKTRFDERGGARADSREPTLRLLDKAVAKLQALPADAAERLHLDVPSFSEGLAACARALRGGGLHRSAIPRMGGPHEHR
ncbi:MAG: DUF309 domain-containing protein, partial [Myxococcota bacterium]|nr:DUF309 domain-containing protein [Myxococcota bacterium]